MAEKQILTEVCEVKAPAKGMRQLAEGEDFSNVNRLIGTLAATKPVTVKSQENTTTNTNGGHKK